MSSLHPPRLEARGIVKDYPSVKVLKDVSFSVEKDDTVAVIGPNGAGKTTLFKTLTGEVFADKGTILFEGRDVSKLPVWQRVRQGFGRSFQVATVFLDLSAAENVLVAVERFRTDAADRGRWSLACRPTPGARDQVGEMLEEVGLANKWHTAARELSHGDKKRLELAMSLALRPRILMLDEPTAGMAPSDRHASIELIRKLRDRHDMTVVLTEHDMGVVFDLATRVLVLHRGELIAEGTPAEVQNDPVVREVYLGSEIIDA